MNTILRNCSSEIEGSRLTNLEYKKGSKIRNLLVQQNRDFDNVLLVQTAISWIEKNHPIKVLKYNSEYICYTMETW